jgi:hypothetical protein
VYVTNWWSNMAPGGQIAALQLRPLRALVLDGGASIVLNATKRPVSGANRKDR